MSAKHQTAPSTEQQSTIKAKVDAAGVAGADVIRSQELCLAIITGGGV